MEADHDDGAMGTGSLEWEDEKMYNKTVDHYPHPELDTSLIMHITDTMTAAMKTMDPTSDTVNLATMPGIAAVGPLNPTDARTGLNFEALVVGMPSSVCCRGTASMDETIKTKLTSAALTSTWPLRPGRAWNPRRLKLNPSRANVATHPEKVNGHAEKTEVSNRVVTQVYLVYLMMNVGVVPIVNVIGPFTPIHIICVEVAKWDLKLGVCAAGEDKLERTPSVRGDKPRRSLALTSPAPPRQRRAWTPVALAEQRDTARRTARARAEVPNQPRGKTCFDVSEHVHKVAAGCTNITTKAHMEQQAMVIARIKIDR